MNDQELIAFILDLSNDIDKLKYKMDILKGALAYKKIQMSLMNFSRKSLKRLSSNKRFVYIQGGYKCDMQLNLTQQKM